VRTQANYSIFWQSKKLKSYEQKNTDFFLSNLQKIKNTCRLKKTKKSENIANFSKSSLQKNEDYLLQIAGETIANYFSNLHAYYYDFLGGGAHHCLQYTDIPVVHFAAESQPHIIDLQS
jgi:hypothetical protein